MPGNILSADTQFPNFAGQESPAEQIRTIRNYLYMLLEQLRYTLNNLDAGNFNSEGLKEIQDAISQPILKQLSDTDGNLAELQVTAAGLASRVSSNEGNISQLEQTAQGLSSRVGDAEGNISSLQQTANGLSSRVSSAEGNISSLQQTANGLSSRVSNAEGSISSLSQTASGLETRVANAEGAVSTVSQKVNGVTVTTGYGQTFLAGDRIVMSSDINNYMAIGANGLEVWINGMMKAVIGQTYGADNYSVILGNTNPAVVQKIYDGSNLMWVGNEAKTCGIMFNFSTGTYQFYGTKVGT
jgi:ABC-type transporter Mla subunit MlaD|nr:MAG TPA: Tail needle protein [Caudoviricetes sp.]